MSEPFARIASMAQDFRLAVRGLRKSPVFLAVVTLSLALGVGANCTIFSVIDTLLYRPLPYDHPEQLLTIWDTHAGEEGMERAPIAESLDWKQQNHVFQDIALTSFDEEAVLSGAGAPEHVPVQDVTPNFFSLLGAKPILGRIFLRCPKRGERSAIQNILVPLPITGGAAARMGLMPQLRNTG